MIIFFGLVFVVGVVLGDCQLNLTTDLPVRNDPVYLVNPQGSLILALPEQGNGLISLLPKQDLYLACTGSGNALSNAGGAVLTNSKCSSGVKLNVNGTDYNSVDLTCTSKASASVRFLGTKCTGNAELLQEGFLVNNDWFPIITSCYNTQIGAAYWSQHILYGTRLAWKVNNSDRPNFVSGDRRIASPDSYYKQQEDAFNKTYGTTKYINRSSEYYIARGHLSPDSDFIFSSWQMGTYFYSNTAPQWQIINNGNWKIMENNIRAFAIRINTDLEDITGTYKILTLPDINNNPVPAYLDPGNLRFPVPELMWKILRNPSDSSCIVIISTNNPYLKSAPNTICPDICSSTNWPVLQKDLTKGYFYCCDYTSFISSASSQAPVLNCSATLNYQ